VPTRKKTVGSTGLAEIQRLQNTHTFIEELEKFMGGQMYLDTKANSGGKYPLYIGPKIRMISQIIIIINAND
jgi:hypothetical protein